MVRHSVQAAAMVPVVDCCWHCLLFSCIPFPPPPPTPFGEVTTGNDSYVIVDSGQNGVGDKE